MGRAFGLGLAAGYGAMSRLLPILRGNALPQPKQADALGSLLDVAQPWERRPARTDGRVLAVAWLAGLWVLVSGALMRTVALPLADKDLESFFFIHPLARAVRSLLVDMHALGLPLIALGVLGLVVAALMTARPTGLGTRALVTGELIVIGGTTFVDALVLALFLLQLVLWLIVIALCVGLVVSLLAGLASS